MPTLLPNRAYGVIGSQLDIPTIAVWIFIFFFVALVFWLQRESKREVYPLKASPFTSELMDGCPPPPATADAVRPGPTLTTIHLARDGPRGAHSITAAS